ncbi:MAG: Glu/Leu/Phe/Val dehydrogenase dimerization domain-containing protein [Rhodobacter sp.]|nr:Glu/Leu/Phe/Val dehydrogenase dimerization domain-containing protein [Rhodobacter sp.]
MIVSVRDCPSHEQLLRVADDATGLIGFIAIHSTARGPAAGGLRFKPYPSEKDAIADVLNLSRGMTYKNAAADLPLGGGKAVILGDPAQDKTPELLRVFGAAIESLHGRYWTAEDMGMAPADMEVLAETTAYVAGRMTGAFASGDPSPATAEGVLRAMRVALGHATGTDALAGRKVAVQGLGNVGWALAEMLHRAGAHLMVADMDPARTEKAKSRWGAGIVATDKIHAAPADVFAPCAIGGILSAQTIPDIHAKVIAGSANNQLATPAVGAQLASRGVIYAPDYVINSGGVILVSTEILQIADSASWLAEKFDAMALLLDQILTRASKTGQPTADIADQIVEERALPTAA